jgi:hypothetical protein
MELENFILSEVSQVQRMKATCFLSYVEYRPNKNKSNIKKKSRSYIREVTYERGRVKEVKKVIIDVLFIQK